MTLNSIGSPHQRSTQRFHPGKPLWFFVVVFLPLFVSLGVWQLNRATEKEQLLAQQAETIELSQIEAGQVPLNQQSVISGRVQSTPVFLLDNKTRDGQFGYEVFGLAHTAEGSVMLSLGWVAGSAERQQLPELTLPPAIVQQAITWRMPPTNAVLDEQANVRHADQSDVWVVQAMTTDWVQQQTGHRPLGFAQLNDAEAVGVGPVIWQPSVMTPAKHRAYAVQWFAMAVALLSMFLYAGFRSSDSKASGQNNNKQRGKNE
ncbi:SURF1 family protein [Reinekea blandensis]|uniref:SURF1 family protein n=1 Tax=Reinekea blandensis TaxID=374838 RepID=UPI0013757908|nr:SURF1 family protein [Reinekea blandensis]